jgi:DNA-binding transcriptional ArsR family regulator
MRRHPNADDIHQHNSGCTLNALLGRHAGYMNPRRRSPLVQDEELRRIATSISTRAAGKEFGKATLDISLTFHNHLVIYSWLVGECQSIISVFEWLVITFLRNLHAVSPMNDTSADTDLDAIFSALADPTRRAILRRLCEEDASVQELGKPFNMSQPAISKHLKVLERAGLISRGKDAQRRPCRLEPQRLKQVAEWLGTYRQFWADSYVRLDDYLQELQTGEPPRNAK